MDKAGGSREQPNKSAKSKLNDADESSEAEQDVYKFLGISRDEEVKAGEDATGVVEDAKVHSPSSHSLEK